MEANRMWLAGALAVLTSLAGAQETVRLSVNDLGFEANEDSSSQSVSSDGRFVAFASYASNLGALDGNSDSDVFVKDRATGEVRLLSRSYSTGFAASGSSHEPSISADGRYVSFTSDATDLVSGDTNLTFDVFRADVQSGEVVRVSVSSAGVQADTGAFGASTSADGRYVAYESRATSLVPGDANGARDVFVHDVRTGVTEIVSVATGGSQVNDDSKDASISADGRYVAFESDATNVVLNDTNGYRDVFVRDRQLGTTERVSITTIGTQLNGDSYRATISGDGSFVSFQTEGLAFVVDNNSMPDVCFRDIGAGTLHGVSHAFGVDWIAASGSSTNARVSHNGRWIAFACNAANIVGGDTNNTSDVFRYDRLTGERVRMSVSNGGSQSSGGSYQPDVTDDGQVLFRSNSADLVVGDSGLHADIFVRNLGPDFPTLHCAGKLNSQGCTPFLTFAGAASASSAQPFSIQGRDFLPGESGFLIYGVNGKANLDFHGGKLCVKLPFSRWLPFKKAKSGAGTCGGVLTRNFNTRVQSGVDALLTAGQVVNAQWLQRDPADAAGFGDGLSNGIRFTIGS